MNATVKGIFGFLTVSFLSFSILSCSKAPAIEGMVYIPQGEFIMGSEEVDTEGLGTEFGLRTGRYYDDEKPMRKVYLDGYYIDKYEVTNAQYKEFINATAAPAPLNWEKRMHPEGRANHPVNNVTWYAAGMYCSFAGKRLPTESEWEKAARGPEGGKYPWGNEYDEKKANLAQEDTMPVGSFETDKSYYGVYDMGGNVMEWTDSWYEPYPGATVTNKDYGAQHKVLKGGIGGIPGHYLNNVILARGATRHHYLPGGAGDDAGFRCAKSLNK